jgi:GNAT superfamily N-acetyltransferase
MAELRILQAEPKDLDRFIDMHEGVRDWLETLGRTPLPHGIHRDSSDYYRDSVLKGEVYVGLLGDETVGCFRLLSADEIVWPEAEDDALYLYSLLVVRQFSGRGFGRQMLNWCEQQARLADKTFLRLDCFANNDVLRNYYEEAGYSCCGEVDARYPFATLRLVRFEKRCREIN